MTDQGPSRAITDIDMAKLAQAIEHFRTLDKEIPAQVIATFLYVASHDDCLIGDLETALTFSTASGSRNTDWLSHKHRLGKRGLNWVIKYRDPTDMRKQIMKLSPQGVLLVKQLRDILYG